MDQVELPWSAQGGVLELTRGQDSGGSAHTDDPLLEMLKRCPGPPCGLDSLPVKWNQPLGHCNRIAGVACAFRFPHSGYQGWCLSHQGLH